jgi:hypothetical protein
MGKYTIRSENRFPNQKIKKIWLIGDIHLWDSSTVVSLEKQKDRFAHGVRMEQGNTQEFGDSLTPGEVGKYDDLLIVSETAWQRIFKINELKRDVRTSARTEGTPWAEFAIPVERYGPGAANYD